MSHLQELLPVNILQGWACLGDKDIFGTYKLFGIISIVEGRLSDGPLPLKTQVQSFESQVGRKKTGAFDLNE